MVAAPPLDLGNTIRRDIIFALEQMGVAIEYSHHEVAPSQHEIDMRYAEALKMADITMTYRVVVKEVARKHGVYATFMPKPIYGQNGSGMHVHQSLFKNGKNLFFDPSDKYHLSHEGKSYIAGILKHAREFACVTNQWVNSYKRLVPGYEAPVYVAWARRNRSALVRVPMYKPGKEAATRMELRCPDPAANPYLTFAVMLAAGLKGMENNYVLPEPVEARFAQLRIESVWGGPGNPVTLGAWKVVAVPGATPDPMPSNIAEPVRGGHIVWMSPQASFQGDADAMLVDQPDDRLVMYSDARSRLRWVVGFQDDRAALVERLEWQDPPDSDPAIRLRRVDVEVSTTTPVGPWMSLGTWRLQRADDGSVPSFALPPGTWVRFLRFTSGPAREGTYQVERPAALRVIEHPTDDTYRSILGEWGDTSPMGPKDLLEPSALSSVEVAERDDETPELATPLPPGTTARDRVRRGQDVDWYSLTIPDDRRSVSFEVGGDPTVGVALTMIDATGAGVPMTFGPGASPGTAEYRANVTPGGAYRVRVEQPPFSAVFTYDTSGSMGDYLSFVLQAMSSYTGGVTRGEEQVLVIPFAEPALLKEWSDDPYLLQGAVGAFRGEAGSSDAETGLLTATGALEGREGARAVLMVTDAETSSYDQNERLWQELGAVRPMVFTVHIGSDGAPLESRRFMQDWAMAGSGRYQYATTHGDMDRAFERMATWLRRPASYRLAWTASEDEVPPPPPGTLSVVAPPDADGTTGAVVGPDVAVELVLDTSGSMLKSFGGERRIDIAKRVLAEMVRRDLPAGLPVAMRTFVRERRSCATELAVPLGPLDPEGLASRIEGLRILGSVRTPLAKAIRSVAADLEGVTGPRIVIVVSDGAESCGGDPAKEVRRLRATGTDVTLNVVGLALDDRATRRAVRRLAALGGGTYFDARDPDEVAQAIRTAVSAPFQVFDSEGVLVGGGTVGGGAIELPPGTYQVVVLTEPRMTYEGIVIEQEGAVTVTLPSAGERPVGPEVPAGSEAPAVGS